MNKNNQEFLNAINEIAESKNIDKNIIIDSIKLGFQKAYEKKIDPDGEIKVEVNLSEGDIKIFKELTVVKRVTNDIEQINIRKAKAKFGEDIEAGDIVLDSIDTSKFNRIAIMLVGQIIRQEINKAERNTIFEEYSKNKGEILHGIVESIKPDKFMLISINEKVTAFMPWKNIIPGEEYQVGDQLQFLALDMIDTKFDGQILASRTSELFLSKLLEFEVPEIEDGIIVIKDIAREPGIKSKVAVISEDPTVEPIGTCVGVKGTRISLISRELNDEKIDIIKWDEDLKKFTLNAFSPVFILHINIKEIKNNENEVIQRIINVIIMDEQYSLAIGYKGVVAKVISKLLKSKINIISYTQAKLAGIDYEWNGNITLEEYEIQKAKLKHRLNMNAKRPNPKTEEVKKYIEELQTK